MARQPRDTDYPPADDDSLRRETTEDGAAEPLSDSEEFEEKPIFHAAPPSREDEAAVRSQEHAQVRATRSATARVPSERAEPLPERSEAATSRSRPRHGSPHAMSQDADAAERAYATVHGPHSPADRADKQRAEKQRGERQWSEEEEAQEQRPGRVPQSTPALVRPDRWYQQTPLFIALLVVLGAGLLGVGFWAINLSNNKDELTREKGQFEQKLRDAEKKARAADDRAKVADSKAKAAQDALRDLGTANNPTRPNPPFPNPPQPNQPLPNQPQPNQPRPSQPQPAPVTTVVQPGLYATHIRMAQEAWQRGETAVVRQLLEPYRATTAGAGTIGMTASVPSGLASNAALNGAAKQDPRNFAWYYLWRAAHSTGTAVFKEHKQTVRHAAFAPDGAKAVTLGDDGMLAVWDGLTGRKLSSMALGQATYWQDLLTPVQPAKPAPAGRAGGLALGPEGQWAAAFGDGTWTGNLNTSAQPQRFGDHAGAVFALAMARNGKLLATGDDRGEIILRELPEGKIQRRWKSGRPQALTFTADSKFLVAGMRHGAVYMWDAASGIVKDSESFGQPITSVAASRDGQTVAVALGDRAGVVCLWEPAARRVRAELRGHCDRVNCVVFSWDGKALLTASQDHTARLWSDTGGLLRTYRGHLAGVEAAAFSPDGQKIITGGRDQTAMVWDAASDPQSDVLTDTPASGWVQGLAFTPGGDQLVGAGRCESAQAFLGLWNLADGNRPMPLQRAVSAGTTLAFSPDGKMMVVGEGVSLDATASARLRVWSLENSRVISTLPGLKGTIASAAYSPDGRLLAAAVGDLDEKVPGMVRVWEPGAGTQRYTLPAMAGRPEAAFTPDGKLLVTVTCSKKRPGEIRLWDAATGSPQGQIDNAKELENLTAMTLSPDGRSLVTGHGDPTAADKVRLKVWDLTKKQFAAQLTSDHPAGITKVVFSRRGKLLASGDAAGNVRIWDFTTGKPLPTQIPSQNRPITGLAFDYLGERLTTAADEKCVRVWHVDSGRALARMELASSAPSAVRFTPDGNSIVATTNTGGLVVWEAESYRVRALLRAEGNPAGQEGHAGEIACATVTATGNRVITGGADKTLRVWDLATRRLLATPFTFQQPISCVAMAPNQKTLAVGTGRAKPDFEPGELLLCRQGDGQTQAVPQALFQGLAVTNLAFTPDANTLAVCAMAPDAAQGFRQSVALVNLSTRKSITLPASDARSMALSPNGKLLAIGREQGEIELWRLESPSMGEIKNETRYSATGDRYGDNNAATQGRNAPSGARWRDDRRAPRQAGPPAPVNSYWDALGGAVPPAASYWDALGAAPPAVSYWDGLGVPNSAPTNPTGFGTVNPSAPNHLSPDWRNERAAELVVSATPVVLLGHRGAVKSLAFSPDGKTLASGAEDSDAKIWDVSTGEALLTFKHNGAVEAVQFSSDGKVLATADREPMHGGVRLWRAAPDDTDNGTKTGTTVRPFP